jgi:hypothetical protein
VETSSQHIDPREDSDRHISHWVAHTDRGTRGEGSGNIQRTLNYSTTVESRVEDSARIISELHREINDLRKEAWNRSLAKERPRNRVNLSQRKAPRYMPPTGPSTHVWAESASAQGEMASSIFQPCSSRSSESHKRSHLNQPLHRDNSPRMKKPSTRKIVQTGEQHAVWKALDLVSSSLFSREIKRAVLPERFTAPRFKAYNGRTDPVAHISHYQKRMDLCRYNDSLMCRLFPSSLGEIALRWFNQLGKRTIASWIQMAEAFVTRFITNCRRTKKMDALLTLKLEDGESIKDYATRFWETYNDIDNCSENVAVRTFKSGLPLETRLRQSLTKRPATTLRKLMDRIEQFIKVEEDGGNTASKQTVT